MNKISDYMEILKTRRDWIPFLLQESGLPGPRGNLELAAAAAGVGDEIDFMNLIAADRREGSLTANEFLPFCGVVGLGSLLAKKQKHVLPLLKTYANDERWRLREAVAMAFQRWGKADMPGLLDEMESWSRGTFLEKRAAAAGLCEPALLTRPNETRRVLAILDGITASLLSAGNRKDDNFRALRKGLAYCWSVAVASLPDEGKGCMEKWMACQDGDVSWIMKENLKKNRLLRMDAAWVESWAGKMGGL